ncbi:MAG: SirB2 family protein [Marinobacter sp.]|nr:SirB2 family protein [Marinobacter sp.]
MMSFYPFLKSLHVATAVISVALFVVRWLLTITGSSGWRRTPLRWLPHLNDTVLLAAAIALAVIAGWNPLAHHWLSGKIVLLVAYVLVGRMALKTDGSRWQQEIGGAAALLIVAAIFTLALKKPAIF